MSTILTRLFAVFLVFSTFLAHQASSQESTLIDQVDSMSKLLYTYNYFDTTVNDASYFSFEAVMSDFAAHADAKKDKAAFYRARQGLFNFHKYKDEQLKAEGVLQSTRDYALVEGDSVDYTQFTYLVGTLFHRNYWYDSALAYFQKSLNLAMLLEDIRLETMSVNAVAVSYANQNRYPESKDYYLKAHKLATKGGDSLQMQMVMGNLALAYARLGEGDSCMYYAEPSYELAVAIDDVQGLYQSLNTLTMGAFLTGDYAGAIDFSNQLYDRVEPLGEMGYMATSYLFRSKAQAELGMYGKALESAKLSAKLTREFKGPNHQLEILEWLVELTEGEMRYQEALDYQKELNLYRDTVFKAESNRALDQLSTQYETRQKEAKISALEEIQAESELKQQFRNLMFVAIILFLAVTVCLIYILLKRKVEKETMGRQKAVHELLRSQLNPHFLFNALSSIQLFLINKGEGAYALEYLSKFAKLMRRILENSRKDVVSLADEVSTLRHYLDLQKLRFDNRFEYRIDLETEDDANEILIPPMFAQPFIENSLEHGISEIPDGLIEINFTQKEDSLYFSLQDNGIGISRSLQMEKRQEHESLATKITHDRIEVLSKLLKKKVGFEIKDRLNKEKIVIGTEVIFQMPIEFST